MSEDEEDDESAEEGGEVGNEEGGDCAERVAGEHHERRVER